jgi:parvulin-like peptidyl-prolyl isomerase
MTRDARNSFAPSVADRARRLAARPTRQRRARPALLAALAAAALLTLLLAAGCGGTAQPTASPTAGQSASPGAVAASPAPGAVAARVDGEAVYRAEVERTLGFSRLSAKALTYKQALEATVRTHLLRKEAARLGITVTDSQVEARLAQVATGLGGTAALQQSLLAVGLTLADYRLELHDGLISEQLGARKFPAAAPTSAQILAFYKAHRGQLTTPAAVRLAEIVVKTQSLGQAVIKRLRQGYPFAEVARAYSMDPESASGGVIGWVTTSSLPPTLSKALAKARRGVIVGPVQAVGGWHVLKLLGRRAASVRSLSAARPAIVAQLTSQRRAALLEAWLVKARAAAHVRIGP